MDQIICNAIISSAFYLLIGMSFWIIYSPWKFFHLSHGAIYTVGAYAAYSILYSLLDLNFYKINISFIDIPLMIYIYAGLAGIMFSMIVGFIIEFLIYKTLRKRKATGLILLLASFGVLIFIQNFVVLIYGNQILFLRSGQVKEGLPFGGIIITPIQIIIITCAIVIFILLFVFFKYTIYGKAVKTVANDSITASIIGVDPEKIILFNFILGSGLAGFSGVLISFETNLEPTMGFNILLKGVIACIIGGIGSLNGVLLGSLFLGLVENLAVWYFPSGWKDAIVFGIFLIFLLFRPQGILGKREN